MTPATIHRTILWLIIILIGLGACTSTPSQDKSLKTSLPTTLTVEREADQPSITAQDENSDNDACTYTDPHPIGQSIAETYAVSYQQVMDWFCSGFSFENILIALETSEAVDIPPDTLLEMLLEKEWEEIWQEIGFTDTP
jgi:hypothetical protein